jgi:hypothetical protein
LAISIALRPIGLGVVGQKVLHEQRCLVARAARPAGRISTLAFLKRHDVALSVRREMRRARPQACVRAAKSPVRQCRPGLRRNFGEYAFLKDSRYMSQQIFAE